MRWFLVATYRASRLQATSATTTAAAAAIAQMIILFRPAPARAAGASIANSRGHLADERFEEVVSGLARRRIDKPLADLRQLAADRPSAE